MSTSDLAISVRGISKAYTISHNAERASTLAEATLQRLSNPFRRANTETFWALKDISFDVKMGEIVGIIGRNGAGKSTLLKILSRITEPTAGEIGLYGRIGSLLEVGTGFHPELTGRENIYLNGQILGMRRKEIDAHFDAIVDFAEIEKFLDTPVKRYSSGMYVRLAFAVAAHLEPEILIVDEVLAVGDAAFQQKCLGKLKNVSGNGRTVLFVSHNLGALRTLCSRAVLLTAGCIERVGPTDEVLADYTRQGGENAVLSGAGLDVRLSFRNDEGRELIAWRAGETITATAHVSSRNFLDNPAVDLAFYTSAGTKVFAIQSDKFADSQKRAATRSCSIAFSIRNPGFACTELTVDLGVRDGSLTKYVFWWQRVEVIPISVANLPTYHVSDAVISPEVQCVMEIT